MVSNVESGIDDDDVATSLQFMDVGEFENDEEPSRVAKWLRPQPEAAGWDKIISAIVPGVLYVSGLGGARDFDTIKQHQITSVLDVASKDPRAEAGMELPAVAEEGSAMNLLKAHGVLRVEEMHLSDSSADSEDEKPALLEALRRLDDLCAAGPVLLHCTAGVSRSCTLATLWLMQRDNLSLVEAFDHVRSARPAAYPNYGFWCVLRDFEKSWRGVSSVRADDLQEHVEVEFVMEEGDEDDDGSGWVA